jgi:protease-4
MYIILISVFSILLTNLFSQHGTIAEHSINPWGGNSVSTSDNLDAFTFNPAGFAVNRGVQKGYYWLSANNDNSEIIEINNDSPFFYSYKTHGFGWSVKYNRYDKLFNATDFKLSFAGNITKSLLVGATWSKVDSSITIGMLMRPVNFLSLGATGVWHEENSNTYSYQYGLALRPMNNHRVTLGIDRKDEFFRYDNHEEIMKELESSSITYMPFIDIELLKGFSLKGQFFLESLQEINLKDASSVFSLSFDFGKNKLHMNQNQEINRDGNVYKRYGIGFQTTSQRKATIFNTPKKQQRFIRLNLDGLFIEEKPERSSFNLNPLSILSGQQEKGKQLKSWIDEIDNFSKDKLIEGLIIDLGSVRAGFSKKQEIYNTLYNFKNSGKKIIVYAKNGISNTDYYLISMADEIYINEMTSIDLRGLAMEVTFYRQLFDTLNIVPEVFRVNIDGDSYKTAGDPYLEKTATKEMKENYGEMLKDLYNIFIEGIAKGRNWDQEKTRNIIDSGPYYLGNEMEENNLITGMMYPDQFDNYVDEIIESKNDNKSDKMKHSIMKWSDIDRSDKYISEWRPKEKNNIALIYAVGGIVSGKSIKGPSGSTIMGDETIKKAIKSAREDESIDAIVLRIDSGGGSALASDQMWREIDLTTNNPDSLNNKPFIASMSDIAASGGYYLACQADKIMASESTITGSIGVIGLSLNMSKFWKQFGINTEIIVKEGEHSDFYTSSRLRSDYETKKIEDSINDIYNTFKQRVIAGRDGLTDINELDNIAMGRIWSGNKAKENLLIDQIGGINDAILLAAKDAGIEDVDNINIIEYPRKDIAEDIKDILKDVSLNKGILMEQLPEEIKDDYNHLININKMTEDGAIMMMPYKIEIK